MMNVDIGNWLIDGIGHYAVFAGERPFLGPNAGAGAVQHPAQAA